MSRHQSVQYNATSMQPQALSSLEEDEQLVQSLDDALEELTTHLEEIQHSKRDVISTFTWQ